MKKLIRNFFRALGYELHKVQPVQPPRPVVGQETMAAAMKRARDCWNVAPSCVIDLGAAEGTWTIKAREVWKEAFYVLFEPLEERRSVLEAFAASHPRIHPVFAAAGSESGTVGFSVSSDLDGSGVYESEKDGGNRQVPVTTIDREIARLALKGPFVIKFDTHGYEVPILKGASGVLSETQLVIMECYGFRIAEKSLLLMEMCAHMERQGFRMIDLVDVMRRPADKAFWQCDVFFLPASHSVFSSQSYS